jgi:HD-GYP domain-containing protein (c-di-GMP phosphodiesterase class II)
MSDSDSTGKLLNIISQLKVERKRCKGDSDALLEELNQAYEDLHLYTNIGSQIHSFRYSEAMLQDLLQQTVSAMRVDLAAALFTTSTEADAVITGPNKDAIHPDNQTFLKELLASMLSSAPTFEDNGYIINNSAELPEFAALSPTPFRALAVAIQTKDKQYGYLLLVSSRMTEIFRRGEFRLLSSMAEQLALVIANTNLYQALEQFVVNLIKSFVNAIDAKDQYTKGHSERVSTLCMRAGKAMNLNPQQTSVLRWASMLHDMGKIGTPERILNKAGALTEAEYSLIKEHPVQGAEIISPIAQLSDICPIIRHHHEHYDGSGYPEGLSGDGIPAFSRIIAVMDTYDAITSNRAYRPGSSHEDALSTIRDCTGSQFDPTTVDVIMPILERLPQEPLALGLPLEEQFVPFDFITA